MASIRGKVSPDGNEDDFGHLVVGVDVRLPQVQADLLQIIWRANDLRKEDASGANLI